MVEKFDKKIFLEYRQCKLAEGYYCNNGFLNYLCKAVQQSGKFITLLPYSTMKWIGDMKWVQSGNLYDEVALMEYRQLVRLGLDLQTDSFRTHTKELVASYLLNTGLCYIRILHEGSWGNYSESFFATKNECILEDLETYLEESFDNKKWAQQLQVTEVEVERGLFQAVRLDTSNKGLKISTMELDIKDKKIIILPMFVVDGVVSYLVNLLKSREVLINYKIGTSYEILHTSLREDVLMKWVHEKEKVVAFQENTSDGKDLGNVVLPKLGIWGDETRIISIFDILEIKILNE